MVQQNEEETPLARDYFDEKSCQVEPFTLVAFGITICSRYGKADEIIEMLACCRRLAEGSLSQYVKELFYDSKGCTCRIICIDSIVPDTPIANAIHSIAEQSFAQFILLDNMHGKDCW